MLLLLFARAVAAVERRLALRYARRVGGVTWTRAAGGVRWTRRVGAPAVWSRLLRGVR